nr:unnamed protein product [Callosobruchus chinensis]
MGPALVKFLNVKQCKEYEEGDFALRVRFHMYNKTTQLFDANLSMPFDLDETFRVILKCSRLDKKQSVFTLEEKDLCHTLPKYVGDFFYDIERKAGAAVGVCPIKKGNYTIKDGYFDLDKFKIKMFLEGSFLTRLQFLKGTRTVGCLDYEIQLAPK